MFDPITAYIPEHDRKVLIAGTLFYSALPMLQHYYIVFTANTKEHSEAEPKKECLYNFLDSLLLIAAYMFVACLGSQPPQSIFKF